MKDSHASGVVASSGKDDTETRTDDIEISSVQESGLTQPYSSGGSGRRGIEIEPAVEASIILIAHPENKHLGSRYRLARGQVIEVGRDMGVGISVPDVLSISRRHALLRYTDPRVTVEDLGSTNGTYVNGQLIRERTALRSGDRFQVAAVHFKFLHERDVENAYYQAISELVNRDGLTDIFNKRKYEQEADREFARATRYKRPLSLIMFDLDDFKKVNDSYGHLCGDFALKQAVQLVRELLRPEQVFARVGGDEFVILSPETNLQGAYTLAQKIRERVASLDYTYCDFRIALTCSFGVAELDKGMSDHRDLYAAADQALYLSKNAGRNRVTAYNLEDRRRPT